MTEQQRSIGIFDNSLATEAALQELNNSHFSLDRVFVIADSTAQETKLIGSELCESLRDRFEARINSAAKQDFGITGKENFISLTQALTQLNIPTDRASFYSDLVVQGKYLIMVEGDRQDLLGVKEILKRCGLQNWVVYKIVLEHPEIIIVDYRDVG